MPKLWPVLLLVAFCSCVVSDAHADTYVRGKSDHPLRYVAYVFYPVGIAVEYLALRPIHKFVSRDPQATIFGHQPRPTDEFPGWAGRKRYDDTKARTPIYTFMTQEPAEDPLQMMQEEMEAEAAARKAKDNNAATYRAPSAKPPVAEEVEIKVEIDVDADPAPVSDRGARPGRIQVDVAETV